MGTGAALYRVTNGSHFKENSKENLIE